MMSAKRQTIDAAYEFVVAWLKQGEEITPEWLRETFGHDLVHRVTLFLDYLVAQGLAEQRVQGRHMVFSSDDTAKITQLLQDKEAREHSSRLPNTAQTPQGEPVSRPAPTPDHSFTIDSMTDALVVSTPLSLAGKIANLFEQYAAVSVMDMRVAFKNLFEQARYEMLLVLPFLELDGLMYFADEIMGLGQRGVKVKILTRELLWPRRYNYSYHQKLKAFAKFIDLYSAGGGRQQDIAVRDYTIRIGNVGTERLLYEGIHQKMIVVDGEIAYVGSGEIRAASFVSNGDAGVIHTGIRARFWHDYFWLFWTEGDSVEHSFFEESIQ
jgi:hypothetical protein